jgi:hypothetical protein
MNSIWNILKKVLITCLIGGVAVWWVLLGTICSEPRESNVTTHHTVPYNCHGTVVFITPLRSALLQWLIPGLLLIGLAWTAAHKRASRGRAINSTRSDDARH